jgi:CBS domain-containing protein
MSSPVISIDGHHSVTEAADLMEQHGTRHLAVLKGDSIVGILSVRDLLHRSQSMSFRMRCQRHNKGIS